MTTRQSIFGCVLFTIALCLNGCTAPAAKIANSLAHDGAVVQVKVSSVYGTVTIFRANPTNGTVTLPDGTSVTGACKP